MKVELPIFWNTDDTKVLEDCGLVDQVDFKDYQIRVLTFYHINIIYKFDNQDSYTVIVTNGDTYVCALPIHKVELMIDGNKNK